MLSETMKVRFLDGSAVLCEEDGCDRPALYLFRADPVGAGVKSLFSAAYCEVHAQEVADRAGLQLPLCTKTARSSR